MITIFNRRELMITYSMQDQVHIREVLVANGIDYRIRVINRNSPTYVGTSVRARHGTFGQNPAVQNEYVFYVHKNDYEKSQYLLRMHPRNA